MTVSAHLLGVLPDEGRARLLRHAAPTSFPAGRRIFEEGRSADRFWVIRQGSVRLDVRVPTRPAAVVDTLHAGDLLGWSWLFPPYEWHLGAQALTPVRALQFDAGVVRAQCEQDARFGCAVARHVARIVAERSQRARFRLLELYGPYGIRTGAGEGP
jgi:CRP-like cAMP-binding protein